MPRRAVSAFLSAARRVSTTSRHGVNPSPMTASSSSSNAGHEPITWIVPSIHVGHGWERLIDTDAYVSGGGRLADHRSFADGEVFEVAPRSLVVMIRGG